MLSHEASAVRMDRARAGAMPLLFNHNIDAPVGMIDGGRARIEASRLLLEATMFDTPQARDVTAMINGGLRNISIGYRLHSMDEDTKTGTFTATDWEPYEASIVSVPADATNGIGRASVQKFDVRMVRTDAAGAANKGALMDEGTQGAVAGASQPAQPMQAPDPGTLERMRVTGILNLTKENYGPGVAITDQLRQQWLSDPEVSCNKVAEEIMAKVAGKPGPRSGSR